MLTKDLIIYKDTYALCKALLTYSKNVSKVIRYGLYEVALSKASAALDLIRRINSSFEDRIPRLLEFILLISEVNSRINLFTESNLILLKQATNLSYLLNKVAKEGLGWLKSERVRNKNIA